MATTFQKLQPSSFKKAPFLWVSESKEGGKKTVTNEFVNSNLRFTEELGILPPKFRVEAVVHGDNSIQLRKELEAKLNEPGLGDLIHPIYGNVQVKSTTYSVSSNQQNIGEFKFSINFESSEENVTASPIDTSKNKASTTAKKAREDLNNWIEGNYKDIETPGALDRITAKLDNIYSSVFDTLSGAANLIQGKVSAFTSTVNSVKGKIRSIVLQGTKIKGSLESVYQTGLDIVNTPQDLIDSWKTLTDFGFIDINALIAGSGTVGKLINSKSVDTAERIIEDSNTNSLNEHTRLTALVNYMEAAAFKEYTTSEEAKTVIDDINSKYRFLVENIAFGINGEQLTSAQLSIYNPIVSDVTVRNSLHDLRTTVKTILDEESQRLWKIEDISPGETSMVLLAYRYYGSLDNLELIENLNPDSNHANFNENIKAVSL